MQAVASAVLLAAPVARADGDPASDVLPGANLFVSTAAPAALTKAVAAANVGGNRVKVAVIGRPSDLGSVTSLYGRPGAYARFLGLELRFSYSGVLVVVMPDGIGVYDHGRPTGALARALAGAGSATTAVERLDAAHLLRYVDVLPPQVVAFPESGRRGRVVDLQYAVSDDSGSAGVTVQVLDGQRALATFTVSV
ncbi:MAG: hypothetical protein JOY72_12740, partial [Actinobacteria bacterium]|nr:hypothetical protein [Actinomycetota bacterium]